MDRLTSMTIFARAVELGSFSAAAAVFHMSPQLVGKHVRMLEQHLGVQLLNRTTRRQHLTEIGASYYDRVKVILAEVGAADGLALDGLDPGVQVLGDLQDLAAHGLQALGALDLGGVQLVADGADRLFDPVYAGAGLGGVETLHHLGAVGLDLAGKGLGQFLEAS